MKEHFKFLSAVILGTAMVFSGCTKNSSDDPQADASISENVSTEPSETELTKSETAEITVSETKETEAPETEIPEAKPEASETETEAGASETETEQIPPDTNSKNYSDMSVEEMLELINQNSKTVGNDTCGYITVYAGSDYEEDDGGSYTVTSETSVISVFRYDYDFQTDLDQTAYMICLSAAMNAGEDGYEAYAINEFIVDGMNGYLAFMLDEDTDLGFMMYAVVIDSAETLRGMSCECGEYTLENLVSQSWTFDTYRRNLTTE